MHPDKPEPHTIRVYSGDGAEADLHVSRAQDSRFGLLWLPALGVTARHYLRLAETLAARGVSVAVHEWRGGGSSNRRASRRCDWGYRELLEFDIPASLDVARKALPGTRWIMAGHSIGGQFACLHAALDARSSEGIALVACGSPYWKTFPPGRRWMLRLVPPAVRLVTWLYGYYPGKRIGFAGSEARTLMRDWAETARTGNYARYLQGFDHERSLRGYVGPLLDIRMAQDALCPQASSERLLGKLPGSDVRRVGLSAGDFENGQASHFSWMKEPGPVAREIADWVHQALEQEPSPTQV